MAQLSVNGTTLYYEGKGQGPHMLFIHGMCGFAEVWSGQIERLSGRFHCITYDRRGHTRSPLGQIKQRTVELHADDAAGLIRELAAVPCIIVGSSGGARVGLDVVRRYPELVAGAVLSEPPLLALVPDEAAAFIGQVRSAIDAAVAKGGPRAAVDAFFAICCQGLWATLSEAQRNPYRDNHAELFGDLQMPSYQITREDLARISRPCLIISGSASPPVLRSIAGIVAGAIRGARHQELAGSGHVTYYERPAEFAAAVFSFAESLGARSG